MSRTLVFCTSYAETESLWTNRYRLWVNAIRGGDVEHDHVLLVDDASPVLPAWPDTRVTNRLTDGPLSKPVTIYRFDKRLGRQARTVYPGWYRSFCFAARFAEAHGFDRVVHIESDGFIVSRTMQHYINTITDEWIAPGIQSHDMPESAIQVMAGTGFRSFVEFAKKPYSESVGYEAENLLPLTRVVREFIGSRYGETLHHVPRDADFVTQTNPSMLGQADYYWWLRSDILPFSTAGKPPTMTSDIQSASEADDRWRLDNGPTRDKAPSDRTDIGPAAPRIIALSMVKNEQDIIEPFVRHTSMFVDHHVILDNGSVDDTRRILTDLMREIDGVIVTSCSEFAYSQSERMTKLLRSCQTAFFADYVIFLDADEFISSESRSEFEQTLARIPVGGYGQIPWRTFVLTPFDLVPDQNDPPRSMPWRRTAEHERYNAVLRLDRKYWHDLVVAQGNHGVNAVTGRLVTGLPLEGLYLNHFPLRSIKQFIAKSIVGWMAYLGKDPHAGKKGDGYHWRHNFYSAINGAPIDYKMLCDLSMRSDQPTHEYDWTIDVMRGDAPDRYERRYSNGQYADPLVLVAKSWQATLEAHEPPIAFTRQAPPSDPTELSEAETAFDSQWHWENPFADVAPFRYLAEKYSPQSILDVGCGIGAYLTLFKNLGVRHVFGADGIPKSATMLSDTEYQKVDLTQPLSLGRKFDIVMCLEVAEHLPPDASSTILETLRAHAGGLIVFSAAEPGQPGHGHINNLPIEQWLRQWETLGWLPSLQETFAMRALSTLSWFKRNIVVLKQGADSDSEAAIRELAHIGSLPYGWHHTNPGVRAEVLMDDTPPPPFGYHSESHTGDRHPIEGTQKS